MRDGLIDGGGRSGAAGACGVDGRGVRRFGEAPLDGAGAGPTQEESSAAHLLAVAVGRATCEEGREGGRGHALCEWSGGGVGERVTPWWRVDGGVCCYPFIVRV